MVRLGVERGLLRMRVARTEIWFEMEYSHDVSLLIIMWVIVGARYQEQRLWSIPLTILCDVLGKVLFVWVKMWA